METAVQMENPVAAFDLQRMIFGDEPLLFLLEIAFRTTVIYVYTFILIRWIGSRSVAQLSLVEFLLVIALGSAVGDAMFYPEVPLIHAMLVITVVILLDKTLTYLVARQPAIEDILEGKTVQIIDDGTMNCEALKRQSMGHDELFEQLRLKDVTQLGEVRAAYLETNGSVSVFKQAKPRPGLAIVPPWDVEEPLRIEAGSDPQDGPLACEGCGNVEDFAQAPVAACTVCSKDVWHRAAAAEA